MNLTSQPQETPQAMTPDEAFVEELKELLGKHNKGLRAALSVTEEGVIPVLKVVEVPQEEPAQAEEASE